VTAARPSPHNLADLFEVSPKPATKKGGRDALDAYFDGLQKAAADPAGTSSADASLDVLATLDEVGDGVLLLGDLLAAGHSRALVMALLTQGTDKRVKPRLAGGVIAGHALVWLRSSGWQAVGQPNRREAAPTARSLRHRLSAHNFESAMRQRVEPSARSAEILLEVVRGLPLREYVKQRAGDVWAVIKNEGAEAGKDASTLMGGVYPDALVAENWPLDLFDQRMVSWPHTGDATSRMDPQPADFAVAVEVELSGKAAVLLSAKVRQHDAAMVLGWWQAVVWITDDTDTQTRLLRAGIGNASEHPGHYLLRASAVGMGDDPAPAAFGLAVPTAPWWQPLLQKR
jgi:hypothetical protein